MRTTDVMNGIRFLFPGKQQDIYFVIGDVCFSDKDYKKWYMWNLFSVPREDHSWKKKSKLQRHLKNVDKLKIHLGE